MPKVSIPLKLLQNLKRQEHHSTQISNLTIAHKILKIPFNVHAGY